MNDKEVMIWKPMVERAARTVARDFPDSTVEDLTQSIWEGLLLHQAKGKLLDPDEKYADVALLYIAKTSAWAERKEHLTISVQYGYRTSDVRKLLETYFDRNDWYGAEVPADAYSELGSAALEMSADLSRAWDKLSLPHKALIFTAFGLRQDTDSKKLSRAISRMADIINTWQPARRDGGLGTRPIITNAHAQYIIANQDTNGGRIPGGL